MPRTRKDDVAGLSDLCIFTANADPLLIASAERHGLTVHSYSPDPWIGYVNGKLREGVKFLQSRTEPYAMWVDGADSLILKPEHDILARIHSIGFPVLIAAERNCWPDASRAEVYPEAPRGRPKYINAGGFIGLRGDVMTAMHTAVREAVNEDDQLAWTIAFTCRLLPTVQIDHGRLIFCSEGDGDTGDADPCVRHWNGRTPGRAEYSCSE